MIFDGLKFGMLLQLSVGPVCLFVFQTSGSRGLLAGLLCVLAAALADAAYITLAGFGASVFFNRPRVRLCVKLFGCVILCLFGLNMVLSVFGLSLLPKLSLFGQVPAGGVFVQGLLLTASNPLTILFWGGVFSAKAAEKNMSKSGLFFFGLGCVLATLLFLTAVALLGSIFNTFLPAIVLTVLNAAVGCLLVFFGIRLMIKKEG
ncbi:LysE family transporter [Acetanaerobacterium elongatum]|uniref:Threonine/homoserine/homoserine lactone efflux protein n=1 Tax=Acetanaerobacterium elongatum TaxID=258515 RepID=A0A1G9XWL4_9FIRM|nr:LysE family transporter [Acetanaerobacterium elongatum]SDN00643.1 Threonine/homoserine/homoserine lactone efflux protein [Acetanaerobacterium elongatum]